MYDALTALVRVLEQAPPLSAPDLHEIYLMARHFGRTAHETRNVLPAWEVELYLSMLSRDREDASGT